MVGRREVEERSHREPDRQIEQRLSLNRQGGRRRAIEPAREDGQRDAAADHQDHGPLNRVEQADGEVPSRQATPLACGQGGRGAHRSHPVEIGWLNIACISSHYVAAGALDWQHPGGAKDRHEATNRAQASSADAFRSAIGISRQSV